ncbi:MAG: hypothetical protein NTW18_01640 [Candidatus Omnitrophica bacterium]|nr:hypothetical protein [Candidatus Omnitrophota bacterium]
MKRLIAVLFIVSLCATWAFAANDLSVKETKTSTADLKTVQPKSDATKIKKNKNSKKAIDSKKKVKKEAGKEEIKK